MPNIRRCSPEIPNILMLYKAGLVVSIWVFLSAQFSLADEISPTSHSSYQTVTGDDSDADQFRWNRLFSSEQYIFGKEPAPILKEYVGLLTEFSKGRALDLAMGEGRNAVFLARSGLEVDGVDLSEVAIRKAKVLAREHRVAVNATAADLHQYEIKPNSYDVILNIDYLQRNLVPKIKQGLRKRGLIVYENFTTHQSSTLPAGSLRKDMLLRPGELQEWFSDFEILVYRETFSANEAKAVLIARKK